MDTISLETWLKDPEALALRAGHERFKGIFGKRLLIPERTVVYTAGPDGPRVIPAGREIVAPADIVMIKEKDFELKYMLEALKSRENFPLTVCISLFLYVDVADLGSLKEFALELLSDREILTSETVRGLFYNDLVNIIGQWTASYSIEELYSWSNLHRDIEKTIRSGLKRSLFKLGIDLLDVRGFEVYSAEYENLREKHRQAQIACEEAKIEATRARARQQIREIWEQDQKGQALSAHEVEEFFRCLAMEGYLKDLEQQKKFALADKEICELKVQYEKEKKENEAALTHALEKAELERKLELDKIRLEHDIANSKKIAEALKGADIEVLISQISDEQIRSELYKTLIEQRMTPEQIKARATNDFTHVNEKLEEIYEKLLNAVGNALETKFSSPKSKESAEQEIRVHRVLVSAGKKVYAYDPKSNYQVNRAREVYDFEGYSLGGIRSIRLLLMEGRRVLAAGAIRGVYISEFENGAVMEFAFPWPTESQGGTNSIALDQDRMFATHGEHGLVCWDLKSNQPAAKNIHHDLTVPNKTTRGVTINGDDLFFATGNEIYALDLARIEGTPRRYQGSIAPISSLAVVDGRLYAGNTDGEVLSWDIDDPASASRELKKAGTIYMIRVGVLGGVKHLIIGCRETGVVAKLISSHMETFYFTDYQIRWADGDGDTVAGIDHSYSNLIIWRTSFPDSPLQRIYLPGEGTDIAIMV